MKNFRFSIFDFRMFGKLKTFALLVVANCLLITSAMAVPPNFPPIKPLELKIPQAKRFELSNRLIVYLIEDHELPQVQMTALLRTGSIYDPEDKIGLSQIFAAVLPYGGTKTLDPDAVTKELELIGSSISAGSGAESLSVSLFSLTKNLAKTFAIYSEILREPRLDAKKLDVEKQKTIGAIARRNDEPRSIARREFSRMLYGAHSPWGRRVETRTIEAITRKDLLAFHLRYTLPNNTMLIVSGDIDEKSLKEMLDKSLGEGVWATGPLQLPPLENVTPKTERLVYLVEKPEAEQSAIRIGHFGIQRNSPDYFAFTIMNEILGGGFSSRLFRNVRSRKALAYAVGSGFTEPRDWGIFYAGIGTKAPSTYQAIDEVLNEIQTLKDEAPEGEEVELAKNQLINSYVQNFSNSHQSAMEIANVEFFDHPKDWLENYTANLSKVTKEDIIRVAKKYLNPEQAVILVVGNPKKFDRNLSTLGKIVLLDPEKGTIIESAKQKTSN